MNIPLQDLNARRASFASSASASSSKNPPAVRKQPYSKVWLIEWTPHRGQSVQDAVDQLARHIRKAVKYSPDVYFRAVPLAASGTVVCAVEARCQYRVRYYSDKTSVSQWLRDRCTCQSPGLVDGVKVERWQWTAPYDQGLSRVSSASRTSNVSQRRGQRSSCRRL